MSWGMDARTFGFLSRISSAGSIRSTTSSKRIASRTSLKDEMPGATARSMILAASDALESEALSGRIFVSPYETAFADSIINCSY